MGTVSPVRAYMLSDTEGVDQADLAGRRVARQRVRSVRSRTGGRPPVRVKRRAETHRRTEVLHI